MKLLIISDTHGNNDNFETVLAKEGMPDALIHCGDVCGSEYFYDSRVACPVKMVLGNNDYGPLLERYALMEVPGHRILITHGHMEGVYYGTAGVKKKAEALGADIVAYGHTHFPDVEYDEKLKIWAVNPGSLTYPRQKGRKPSYIIMEAKDNGEVSFEIKYLDIDR